MLLSLEWEKGVDERFFSQVSDALLSLNDACGFQSWTVIDNLGPASSRFGILSFFKNNKIWFGNILSYKRIFHSNPLANVMIKTFVKASTGSKRLTSTLLHIWIYVSLIFLRYSVDLSNLSGREESSQAELNFYEAATRIEVITPWVCAKI